jgi:hypothetical protein
LTQTAVAVQQTATAQAAGTATAVAQTQVAAPATARAALTATAAAALTQVPATTPIATVILPPGTTSGACATTVGGVCQFQDDPNGPGVLEGTATKIGSMRFTVTATSPVVPVAGSVPAVFLPTTIGVESFFVACSAVPAAAPFTTTCTGVTVGDVLQGAVITVRFANAAGGVTNVTGIAVGPGAGVAAPIVPPAAPPLAQPAGAPPAAIPANPRPPLQFIPAAPAPLLPPRQPLQPPAAAVPFAEIPVIPEADTLALLLGGAALLGAVALGRRRTGGSSRR